MNEIDHHPALPPEPPIEPDPLSCCGNECGEACVWTIYQRARWRYEAELAQWQVSQVEPPEA